MIPEQPASARPASAQSAEQSAEQPAEQSPARTSAGPAVCATCGTVATGGMPSTWSLSTEAGRRLWTCERCAREHLRSIEAKLDSAWW